MDFWSTYGSKKVYTDEEFLFHHMYMIASFPSVDINSTVGVSDCALCVLA